MDLQNSIQIQSCDAGIKGTSINRSLSVKRPLFRKLFPLISVKLTSVKRSPLLRGGSNLFRGPNELLPTTRSQNNRLPFLLSSPRVCSDRWNQVEQG